MSGFDERDATSAQRPPQDFHAQMLAPRDGASAGKPLAGLRIGLPTEFFPAGLAADVNADAGALIGLADRLVGAGVTQFSVVGRSAPETPAGAGP